MTLYFFENMMYFLDKTLKAIHKLVICRLSNFIILYMKIFYIIIVVFTFLGIYQPSKAQPVTQLGGNNYKYNKATNMIYLLNGTKIYKYSYGSWAKLDSVNVADSWWGNRVFEVSEDGQFIYVIASNPSFYAASQINEYRTSDFTLSRSFYTSVQRNYNAFTNIYKIWNGKIIALENSQTLTVIDIQTGNHLADKATSNGGTCISSCNIHNNVLMIRASWPSSFFYYELTESGIRFKKEMVFNTWIGDYNHEIGPIVLSNGNIGITSKGYIYNLDTGVLDGTLELIGNMPKFSGGFYDGEKNIYAFLSGDESGNVFVNYFGANSRSYLGTEKMQLPTSQTSILSYIPTYLTGETVLFSNGVIYNFSGLQGQHNTIYWRVKNQTNFLNQHEFVAYNLQERIATFEVKNIGLQSATIDSVHFTTSLARRDFVVQTSLPIVLAPNETKEFDVKYIPRSQGNTNYGEIQLLTNASNEALLRAKISAISAYAAFQFYLPSGQTYVAQETNNRITYRLNTPSTITIPISDSSSPERPLEIQSVTSSNPEIVYQGYSALSKNLSFRVNPQTSGTHRTTIKIMHNGFRSPDSLNVEFVAKRVGILELRGFADATYPSLDFKVFRSGDSDTKSFYIYNSGDDTLRVSDIYVNLNFSANMAQVTPRTLRIPPQESAAVQVVMKVNEFGRTNLTIESDNYGYGSLQIDVTTTLQNVYPTDVVVPQSTTWQLGDSQIGQTYTNIINITNNGYYEYSIALTSSSGVLTVWPTDFSIRPGETIPITLTFKPQTLSDGNHVWINMVVGGFLSSHRMSLVTNVKVASDQEIPTAFASHKVYPNPVFNVATKEIDLPSATILNIEMFDLLGRVVQVKQYSLEAGSHKIPLDVTGLSAGTYFLRLISSFGIETQSLIIAPK